MPIKPETVRSKGIHVKMDRLTHAAFKAKLAFHGLSMQDAFEEFARLVGCGSPAANRMLDSLVKRQVRSELAEVGMVPLKGHKRRRLGELDVDKLYDLINNEPEDQGDT